ncbi:CGNR zinc finger domain-containing protein [Streptomyces sp. NPDC005865]|uniref:CGNR zinc finger domain-containing protein n=1 Tax=Streptomyces sp. NPDC005865 TaxID=3155453 RepID=UPI0033C2D1A8
MARGGSSVTVSALTPDVLVDLVNGWGTWPRQEGQRTDEPLPSLDSLDALHSSDSLGDLALPGAVRDALDADAVARVADAIHPVFAADDAPGCADRLTRLLSAAGARPVLTAAPDGTLHAVWSVAAPDGALLAAAAVTLRAYLAEHGWGRIGLCAGAHCADVYIDQSPGGRRRFCSVTCQNRTRVAAFRSRRAAAAE